MAAGIVNIEDKRAGGPAVITDVLHSDAQRRAAVAAGKGTRKRLIRRAAPDRSQKIRHWVQWAFFALNVWIGAQFYLWVRYFVQHGHTLYVSRPAGV